MLRVQFVLGEGEKEKVVYKKVVLLLFNKGREGNGGGGGMEQKKREENKAPPLTFCKYRVYLIEKKVRDLLLVVFSMYS